MSPVENKISQFWQELKRRKVVRVIAMYAGAAYVIIELVGNIAEPLHLPEWTATLVIVLLLIGFPVVIILSWIFDYTAKGYVKTKPVEPQLSEDSGITRFRRKFRFSDGIIIVLFVTVCILVYPKIFETRTKIQADPDGKISIAVMPFKNLTTDTLFNIWQEGIQHILISSLSNSPDLAIRQSQTMHDFMVSSGYENYAAISPGVGGELAQKLETNTYISGQLIGTGNSIRINVQLRDAVSEEIYQSYEISGSDESEIPFMADSLSLEICNFLEIEVLNKEVDYETSNYTRTTSSEAYRSYLMGRRLFWELDHNEAVYYFKNAIEIDSNFLYARIFLGWSYGWLNRFQERKEIFDKLNENMDEYSSLEKAQVKFPKNWSDKDPEEGIRNLKIQLEYDPKQRVVWYQLASCYDVLEMYEQAIDAYEQSLQIDIEWGGGWEFSSVYYCLGEIYHRLGYHEREEEIYTLGLTAVPDEPHLIFRQAVCATSQMDTIKAARLLNALQNALQKDNRTDSYIAFYTGQVYEEARQYDRAIEYYNQSIATGQDEYIAISAMLRLSFILISNTIDLERGIYLADQVLDEEPEEVEIISDACYARGLGYYKQKQYPEALSLLEKAWDKCPGYKHDLKSLITEVGKAVSNVNN